ncbi:MAG: tetratricopeptide repeat protein, partial [Burkholderiales bacterium]|nr:tetratricopeptide repeat protein [Burkholderiales bacterium]
REVGDRLWEGNSRCNLGLLHHEQGRSAQALTQFEAALTIAREVGHVRLESTVLCNLGLALEAQGDWPAAHTHYVEAVAGARALADPRLEGQFRASLGLLLARQGRVAEGRECLVIGEALLRESSDRLSLALLLCARAESEHLAGASAAALQFLQEARVLATQADVGEDSELGRALARLKSMLEATSAA